MEKGDKVDRLDLVESEFDFGDDFYFGGFEDEFEGGFYDKDSRYYVDEDEVKYPKLKLVITVFSVYLIIKLLGKILKRR